MANLTAKFTVLESQITTQHGEIKSRLDAIIEKLGTINTTITNNGTFDTAPIVNAIDNLRGKVIDVTPGATLLQVLNEIVALRGTGGPETTLRSINQSIWAIAGPPPGAALTDLKSILQKIVDTLGDPSSISPLNITVRGLLDDIRSQWASGAGLSAYNLLDAHYLLQAQLLAQFNTNVVLPTMKDLMLDINRQQAIIAANTTNPLTAMPVDGCAAPLVSTGSFFLDTTVGFVTPVTVALWPETPGGDFTSSYDIAMAGYPRIHCTDWTAYRIYVASKADTFGVVSGRGDRYPCNKWIVLSVPEGLISGAVFNVHLNLGLTVYICPIQAATPSACPGFEGATMYGPSAITAPVPGLYLWANGGESIWQDAGFVVVAASVWLYGAEPYTVQTVSPVGVAGTTVTCCIAIQVDGTAGLSIQRHVPSTNELAQVQFISSRVTDETVQVTAVLACGTPYVFQASVYSGSPTVQMWITQSA
jgi:hypothetical protein